MGKIVDLSASKKSISKRQLRKSAIIVFIIGLLWIFSLMIPWLFLLKPYKEFGHYQEEAVYNLNTFVVDSKHLRILYEIDGNAYENVILYDTPQHFKRELDFYYQKDDPYYLLNDRPQLLIVFPCVAAFGLIWCGCAVFFYKLRIKDINDKSLG